MADTKEQEKAYIAGLIRERAGREIDDDKEALKAIDAELKRLGHDASPPAKRASERPAKKGTER
jgi:hypothetical protein